MINATTASASAATAPVEFVGKTSQEAEDGSKDPDGNHKHFLLGRWPVGKRSDRCSGHDRNLQEGRELLACSTVDYLKFLAGNVMQKCEILAKLKANVLVGRTRCFLNECALSVQPEEYLKKRDISVLP